MKPLLLLVFTVLVLAGCGGGAATTLALNGQIVFSQPSYSCAGIAQVAWKATLTDKIGGLKATAVIATKVGGMERSVSQQDIPVTSPTFDLLSDTGEDVAIFCAPPFGQGDYIMRIVRPSDSKVLAEGTFTITR